MIHKNYIRATREEQVRIDRMLREVGCIVSRNRMARGLAVPSAGRVEVHHLTIPGQRLGHWFSIGLHGWYHSGIAPFFLNRDEARALFGASLKDGTRAFNDDHGTEEQLWEQVQALLDLPAGWPVSKRIPRRTA